MKSRPEVIEAFSNLGKNTTLSEEKFKFFEEYVCQLYQPRTKEKEVARLRWTMIKRSQAAAERIPPTASAFQQHVLRAHYQCLIWFQDNVAQMKLPCITEYGWVRTNGSLCPVVSSLQPAPQSILELVRCKCVKGRFRVLCSCSFFGMVCTQMCKCEGDPDTCENTG